MSPFGAQAVEQICRDDKIECGGEIIDVLRFTRIAKRMNGKSKWLSN